MGFSKNIDDFLCVKFVNLIRSDNNEDETQNILLSWSQKWRSINDEEKYHSIEVNFYNSTRRFEDQQRGPLEWSRTRFSHIMSLREEGIQKGRKAWADWVLFNIILLLNLF